MITYETVTEDMGLPGGSLLDNNRGDGDTNTNTNTNTNVPVNNPSDNTGTTTTGAGAALPAGVVAPGTLQDGTLRLQIAYYRNATSFWPISRLLWLPGRPLSSTMPTAI